MSEPDIELHNKVETPESKGLSVVRELVVHQSVLDAMASHVGSDTTVENGGVMLGQVDEKTGTVTITGSIAAVGAVSRVASLTFTHETWDHISEVQEQSFPDTKMVGWYHSHPHFGIFLSDHDLFIHRNFFVEPWQVAYVIDPLLQQEGFFVWEDGEVARLARWQVVSDGGSPEGHLGVQEPARGMVPPPPAAPPKRGGTIMGMMAIGLSALLVGGIGGWYLSNNREDKKRESVKLVQIAPTMEAQKRPIGAKAIALVSPPGGTGVPFFVGINKVGPIGKTSPYPTSFNPGNLIAVQSYKGEERSVVLSKSGRSIWRSDLEDGVDLGLKENVIATGLAVALGRIWISTNTGLVLRLNLDSIQPIDTTVDLHESGVTTLFPVDTGTVAVTNTALYSVRGGSNGDPKALKLGGRAVVATAGNRVWVATTNSDRPSERTLSLYTPELTRDPSPVNQPDGIPIRSDATLSAVGQTVWVSHALNNSVARVSSDGTILYTNFPLVNRSVSMIALNPTFIALLRPGAAEYEVLNVSDPGIPGQDQPGTKMGVRTRQGPQDQDQGAPES